MEAETGIEHDERRGRGPYRRRPLSEKRKIVELCLRPGTSVAGIALAHGVNANLVRKWIGKYRAGELGEASIPLLPVTLQGGPGMPQMRATPAESKGFIEIDLANKRLRIHGRVDADSLRIVLGCMAR